MLEFKEFIKHYNSEIVEERASTFDGVLVNALYEIILPMDKKINEIRITSQELQEYL